MNLDEIRSRLVKAGYPRPGGDPGGALPPTSTRETSREAQEARAELRDHIIEDIWALLDEVETLRARRDA